jgi:hypothetical protein
MAVTPVMTYKKDEILVPGRSTAIAILHSSYDKSELALKDSSESYQPHEVGARRRKQYRHIELLNTIDKKKELSSRATVAQRRELKDMHLTRDGGAPIAGCAVSAH